MGYTEFSGSKKPALYHLSSAAARAAFSYTISVACAWLRLSVSTSFNFISPSFLPTSAKPCSASARAFSASLAFFSAFSAALSLSLAMAITISFKAHSWSAPSVASFSWELQALIEVSCDPGTLSLSLGPHTGRHGEGFVPNLENRLPSHVRVCTNTAGGLPDNHTARCSDRGGPLWGFFLCLGKVDIALSLPSSSGWGVLISALGLLLLSWWTCARNKPLHCYGSSGHHVAFFLLGFYFGKVYRFGLCLLGWLDRGTELLNRPMDGTALKDRIG